MPVLPVCSRPSPAQRRGPSPVISHRWPSSHYESKITTIASSLVNDGRGCEGGVCIIRAVWANLCPMPVNADAQHAHVLNVPSSPNLTINNGEFLSAPYSLSWRQTPHPSPSAIHSATLNNVTEAPVESCSLSTSTNDMLPEPSSSHASSIIPPSESNIVVASITATMLTGNTIP